jgi:hypothetical protein
MKKFLLLFYMLVMVLSIRAQDEINYDESKVTSFILPDPLLFPGGRKVKTVKSWENKRRPQILKLFEEQMFGKIPAGLKITSSRTREESDVTPYKNGKRKQIEMVLEQNGRELRIQMLMYLPINVVKAPLFLGYNSNGNHAICKDVDVFITDSWCENNSSAGIGNHQFTEQSRGLESRRWPVQMILDAGYGLATIYYGDVDPDCNDFSDGVHPFMHKEDQTKPLPDQWGSISAWSWGLSQAMETLENEPSVDASKVIVLGHSRLGKTALWAGALDSRFALVISNESGCGGAALSRRIFGETVKKINSSFPHWFCDNFKAYNDNEQNLPFDQHELIALIAPRPVYISSAQEDLWADPKGEYLGGYYASPVYQLYGMKGLESAEPPAVSQPVMNQIGYHVRPGKHDMTAYDWEQFIRFADLNLKKEIKK